MYATLRKYDYVFAKEVNGTTFYVRYYLQVYEQKTTMITTSLRPKDYDYNFDYGGLSTFEPRPAPAAAVLLFVFGDIVSKTNIRTQTTRDNKYEDTLTIRTKRKTKKNQENEVRTLVPDVTIRQHDLNWLQATIELRKVRSTHD